MKKILKFKLNGKFGFFKYPFTSPNKLKKTYNIPPRTTILGILGSIIGLEGFQNFIGDEPEYYEKLKHINMFICMNKIPQKKLITYNSLNSFAKNIALDSNVIIQEEILLNPEYEIGLLLDENLEYDKKILDTFNRKFISSKYHIYLGKNEFFANISEIEIFDENNFVVEELDSVENLKSIVFKKFVDFNKTKDELVIETFSRDINFTKKRLKTINKEVIFLLEQDNEVYFNSNLKLYNLNGNYYFMF